MIDKRKRNSNLEVYCRNRWKKENVKKKKKKERSYKKINIMNRN